MPPKTPRVAACRGHAFSNDRSEAKRLFLSVAGRGEHEALFGVAPVCQGITVCLCRRCPQLLRSRKERTVRIKKNVVEI